MPSLNTYTTSGGAGSEVQVLTRGVSVRTVMGNPRSAGGSGGWAGKNKLDH